VQWETTGVTCPYRWSTAVGRLWPLTDTHCQTDRSRSTIGVGPEITARTSATSGPHQPLHPSADVASLSHTNDVNHHSLICIEQPSPPTAGLLHTRTRLTVHRVSIADAVWPAYITILSDQGWKWNKEVLVLNLVLHPHLFPFLSLLFPLFTFPPSLTFPSQRVPSLSQLSLPRFIGWQLVSLGSTVTSSRGTRWSLADRRLRLSDAQLLWDDRAVGRVTYRYGVSQKGSGGVVSSRPVKCRYCIPCLQFKPLPQRNPFGDILDRVGRRGVCCNG